MLKNRLADDSGAVALLFAVVFLVLVGFAALAVDVGYWYTSKRQLQSAADAAALAGARELAEGGTQAAVQSMVDSFAAANFTAPLNAPASSVASTEIGDDYVKVTCQTNAQVFLAQWIMGTGTTLVQAQAVAEVGWLAGASGPVPWGLNILRINDMDAILGGEEIQLADDGSGTYSGTFSAGRSGPLTVRAVNSQDYTEDFTGLVTVGTLPSGGRIASIDVDDTTFTSGVDSSAHVTVTLVSPLATGGGNKVQASTGGSAVTLAKVTETVYEGDVSVPGTSDPYETVTLEVTVKEATTQKVECALLARRANYILQEVDVHPIAASPGDAVTVSVTTLDFEYGVQYQLKVEGGTGTTGNFQALDFAALNHSECGYPEFGAGGQAGGADYRENIVGNPDLVAHINDYVTTKPGDMIGPTNQGVDERLAGYPLLSFDQWVGLYKPNTPQLCVVPICEKVEDQNGRGVLRIVSFATFFLEEPPGGQDPIIGRFIEWTAPGTIVTGTPPGELAVLAPHLTTNNLEF